MVIQIQPGRTARNASVLPTILSKATTDNFSVPKTDTSIQELVLGPVNALISRGLSLVGSMLRPMDTA